MICFAGRDGRDSIVPGTVYYTHLINLTDIVNFSSLTPLTSHRSGGDTGPLSYSISHFGYFQDQLVHQDHEDFQVLQDQQEQQEDLSIQDGVGKPALAELH